MTKTIFVCLICLLSTGCAVGVEGWEIEASIAKCADRGGIDHMPVTFGARIVCRDGTIHEIAIKRGG